MLDYPSACWHRPASPWTHNPAEKQPSANGVFFFCFFIFYSRLFCPYTVQPDITLTRSLDRAHLSATFSSVEAPAWPLLSFVLCYGVVLGAQINTVPRSFPRRAGGPWSRSTTFFLLCFFFFTYVFSELCFPWGLIAWDVFWMTPLVAQWWDPKKKTCYEKERISLAFGLGSISQLLAPKSDCKAVWWGCNNTYFTVFLKILQNTLISAIGYDDFVILFMRQARWCNCVCMVTLIFNWK